MTESSFTKSDLSKSVNGLKEDSILSPEIPDDGNGDTKEEVVSDNDDIYLFLQKNEIGLSPEEAKKTSEALGK